MRQVNLISRSRGFSLAAVVGLQLLAGGSLAAVPAPGHGEDGGHAGTIRIGAPALTIPPGADIPVTIDENIALKRDQVGRTGPRHP